MAFEKERDEPCLDVYNAITIKIKELELTRLDHVFQEKYQEIKNLLLKIYHDDQKYHNLSTLFIDTAIKVKQRLLISSNTCRDRHELLSKTFKSSANKESSSSFFNISSDQNSNEQDSFGKSNINKKGNDNIHGSSNTDVLGDTITLKLQKMHRIMEEEVQRSALNMNLMSSSTQVIQSTQDHYDQLEGTLRRSRNLIGRLWNRERRDQFYINIAFGFFILSCLFVMVQRIGMGGGMGRFGPYWNIKWNIKNTIKYPLKSIISNDTIEQAITDSSRLNAMESRLSSMDHYISSSSLNSSNVDIPSISSNPSSSVFNSHNNNNVNIENTNIDHKDEL